MRYFEPAEIEFAASLARWINQNQPRHVVSEIRVELLHDGEPTGVGVRMQGDGSSHAVVVE